MKLADLNWGDIISKVVIGLVPIVLGSVMLKGETDNRVGLEQRHDSLLVAFHRYRGADSLRDTTQGRDIRQLKGKIKRGARLAPTDTLVVLHKALPWYKRWWRAVTQDSTK